MSLVKFQRPTVRFNSGYSNLFHELLKDDLGSVARTDHYAHIPAVNISETEQAFHIELAAPGYEKKDFQIDVLERSLTIKVELEKEAQPEGLKFNRREFAYRNFSRVFNLPKNAKADKISAAYEAGVLKIEVQKEAPKKPAVKTIKIA